MSSNSKEIVAADTSGSSDLKRTALLELEGLPREVHFHILSKLPVLSLLECKLLSKFWYKSVKDPMLTSMHLTHTADKNNLCILIFTDWGKCRMYLADLGGVGFSNPETVKVLRMPFEPLFPEFEVVGSCNGLVCLYNYIFNDPLFIYNPFTIEYRELPKLCIPNIRRVVFGFGYNSVSKVYKAIKIIYYETGSSNTVGDVPEIFVLTLGTPTWRNIGKMPHQLAGPTSEAEVNGNLHWQTNLLTLGQVKYRDIVSFDMDTEQFHVVPQPSCGGLNNGNSYHLVALQGCLSVVVLRSGGLKEVWIMKNYNMETSWTKAYIVGNYVPSSRMNMPIGFRMKKNGHRGAGFQVLCSLKNGEILFLYLHRYLGCYNPETGEFRELNFRGLPSKFQADVHFGSLISVNAVLGI